MGKKLADTKTRVIDATQDKINRQIRRETEARIFYYAEYTDLIEERLAALDQEWDIERTLETNAAGISLFGILMSLRSRKWILLPLTVAAFLMQHALEGWCPPIKVFRRIRIRTANEINDERTALRVLRGDFDEINVSEIDNSKERAQKALEALEEMS
jgi:hypothetical protein